MSYSVRLTDGVRRKIARWGLSSHAIREILNGLDALGVNPDRRLLRVGPPDDALQYDWVVHDPGDPPRDYLFVFTIRYTTDEETLVVHECAYQFEGPAGSGAG